MAKITLNWVAGTGPIVEYKIYRDLSSFNSTDFQGYVTSIASVSPSATSYEDTTIDILDELYYYGVAAVDANGNEALSEVVAVSMISAPTELTAAFSVN